MLMVMPALRSASVKASDVNCEPWSVLKISGFGKLLQRLSERLQTEARLHGVGQPPREHAAAVPVDDGHQVGEAVGHRDVRDVRSPDVIWPEN